MRLARLAIALGLIVGIAVFAVFVVKELEAGYKVYASPSNFGAADTAPPPAPVQKNSRNPMAGLNKTDPSKFIPIVRDNPHPGQIPPFMQCDPFGQPPYRQPSAGGEVWEFCVYQVADASLTDLIGHYNTQAQARGMRLTKQKPTSDNLPGGLVASWSDGRAGLQVTATPLRTNAPALPPLAPATPLRWVVKYSYPEPNPAP